MSLKEPDDPGNLPRGKLPLALAEVKSKDGLYFKVTSADRRKFYFRAKSNEEAENWMSAIERVQSEIEGGHLSDLSDEDKEHNMDKEGDGDGESTTYAIGNCENQDGNSIRRRVYGPFKDVAKTIRTAEEITAQLRQLMIDKKRRDFQVVAAIDFGSSYTGCAFSFKFEYKKNPLKIHTVHLGEGNSRSNKEPTVLLLNPEGKFNSFGSEAEGKYAQLELNNPKTANNWYLFRRFKMQLYNNTNLTKFIMVSDIGGKSLKTVDVFAVCIEHIKDVLLKKIREEKEEIKEYDVRWVLNCPAMWNESSRQIMIEAAIKRH